jgi:hypothetical protein
MYYWLLIIAETIIKNIISTIGDDKELGEQLIRICIFILEKAVKITETDMDDKLLELVKTAINKKELKIENA